jgi:hypothetical protein
VIRHATFNCMSEGAVHTTGFGSKVTYYNQWLVLKKMLEEGNDTFIWVVTRKQMPNFTALLKKYDLEKFCTLKMLDYEPMTQDYYGDWYPAKAPDKEGVTNFNYPEDHRKLKLFVMKGAKA